MGSGFLLQNYKEQALFLYQHARQLLLRNTAGAGPVPERAGSGVAWHVRVTATGRQRVTAARRHYALRAGDVKFPFRNADSDERRIRFLTLSTYHGWTREAVTSSSRSPASPPASRCSFFTTRSRVRLQRWAKWSRDLLVPFRLLQTRTGLLQAVGAPSRQEL